MGQNMLEVPGGMGRAIEWIRIAASSAVDVRAAVWLSVLLEETDPEASRQYLRFARDHGVHPEFPEGELDELRGWVRKSDAAGGQPPRRGPDVS
jgi:hypothetical protein